ncbi:MAG: PA2779 family protein [Gammaproteobacteria bacterium]
MRFFSIKKLIIAQVSALLMLFTQIAPLQAALVDIGTLMSNITRASLIESLDRTEVQGLLVSMGVDKDAATIRIQTMNENELARLQQEFQLLPAGAGGVETVAVLFLILIATDYAGITDIFPFVNKSKK